MRCHYRNVKATTKVYKPCLSFFISFSLFHVCHVLFPHFIDPSTLTVCTRNIWNVENLSIVFYRSHSPYMQSTKPWQTWMASQSYFKVRTVCTRNIRNHDRLPPVWSSLRLAPITLFSNRYCCNLCYNILITQYINRCNRGQAGPHDACSICLVAITT